MNYRKDCREEQSSSSCSKVPTSISYTWSEASFLSCVSQALDNIASNPMFRIRKSGRAAVVVKCAESIPASTFIPLHEPMKKLFAQDVLTDQERETMFTKMHTIRLDEGLRNSVIDQFTCVASEVDKISFYQCVIDDLVTCLLKEYREGLKQSCKPPKDLTQTERGVLYYVAGSILQTVGKRKFADQKILGVCCYAEAQSDMSVVSEWTDKMNRGGLKFASRDYFELIRECDRVVACCCSNTLAADTFRIDTIIDTVMDSAAAKLHWDAICQKAGSFGDYALVTLEYIIKAFIAMKGAAVARRERMHIRQSKEEASKSLRHNLRGSQKWGLRCCV